MSDEIKVEFPQALIDGVGDIKKMVLTKIDEIQCLVVGAGTSIKQHSHDAGQWEVWLIPERRHVYVCMPGKRHELHNESSDLPMTVMAIKGRSEVSYQDFQDFFVNLGYSVMSGSIWS